MTVFSHKKKRKQHDAVRAEECLKWTQSQLSAAWQCLKAKAPTPALKRHTWRRGEKPAIRASSCFPEQNPNFLLHVLVVLTCWIVQKGVKGAHGPSLFHSWPACKNEWLLICVLDCYIICGCTPSLIFQPERCFKMLLDTHTEDSVLSPHPINTNHVLHL